MQKKKEYKLGTTNRCMWLMLYTLFFLALKIIIRPSIRFVFVPKHTHTKKRNINDGIVCLAANTNCSIYATLILFNNSTQIIIISWTIIATNSHIALMLPLRCDCVAFWQFSIFNPSTIILLEILETKIRIKSLSVYRWHIADVVRLQNLLPFHYHFIQIIESVMCIYIWSLYSSRRTISSCSVGVVGTITLT